MDFNDLRPFQKKAIEMLRSDWKEFNTHVLYASVAFGKTAVASYLCKMFTEKGLRVLFIAPYTVLVEQTALRFKEYGLPDSGIIWQDHPGYDPEAKIQIASADTLVRRNFPENIDLIIIDECHIRRVKLLEIVDEGEIPVIGLSGTPFAKWMGKHYDNLIKPCSMRELIDQGFLCDYEFYAPMKPDLSGVKTSNLAAFGNDYNEKDVAEIMGDADIVGNIVANWLENGQNRQTICFCVNVAHAGYVTNEFIRSGVPAEIMTAKTPHADRKEILASFDDGITKIIVNVGVLVAGFDADVRCIIYARPTKSEIRWIQCLGRGLRTAKGKDHCLIFDHSGSVHELGFPDQIEYDSFFCEDVKSAKQKIKEEIEKIESKPKECTKCHFMKPAGVRRCPRCKYLPVGGEDVVTDETRQLQKLQAKLDADKPMDKLQKQSWYSQLIGYREEALSRGKTYSMGWVAHKYKEKIGVWPRNLNEVAIPCGYEVRNSITAANIRFAKSRNKK